MFANVQICQHMYDVKKESPKALMPFLNNVKWGANNDDKIKEKDKLATTINSFTKRNNETTKICQELKAIKQDEFLHRKHIQRLYKDNHELRLLEAQIKTACISKELADQRLSNINLEAEKLKEQKKFNKEWELICAQNKQSLKDDEENERKKKAAFMVEIKKQMDDIELRRLKERAKIIEDRAEMQKHIERINLEEVAKQENKSRLRQMQKNEMDEHLRECAKQKLLNKQEEIDYLNEYIQYQKKKDDLNAMVMEERNKLLAEKMALSERISKHLEELQRKQIERDNLLLSLLVEERKAIEDERYRQNIEKQIQAKRDLGLDLKFLAKEVKTAKEAECREEERQVREQRKQYLEEYNELTQKSLEERKLKLLEYNRILQGLIKEREKQKTKEALQKIKEEEMLISQQRDRDQQIEAERIKLLQSLPPEILQYLPKSCLRAMNI